jgi:hypothetical protein
MTTQKQRERAPRRDKVYGTNAERHRAHRARKKAEREETMRASETALEIVSSVRVLAEFKPETFGYFKELNNDEVLKRIALEFRERKGPFWDSLQDFTLLTKETERKS